MAIAVIQPAFSSGELSPSLYGRVDLSKYHTGATTMRNMFANYRGGASSRAGMAFVGQCLQPGTAAPPRDIPFQFSVLQGYALEFGDQYMRVKVDGAYVTEAAQDVASVTNNDPCYISVLAHGWSNGDWVFFSNMEGTTQLENQTYVIANVTTDTFTINSTLTGEAIDSTNFGAFVSGNASRIYTLQTPYAAVDLPYLKFTQSADVMSLTLVNQETDTEYPPYDLARLAANSWTLTPVTFGTVAVAPATTTASASTTTTSNPTQYQFVVTSIDFTTGQESVASPIATVTNSVDIAQTQGSLTIGWGAVTGASSYNIYKAPEAYAATVPVGSLFSYLGEAVGLSFVDNNITPDFTTVPPQHKNPFSPGQITGAVITAQGTSYVQATTTITINTSTGSGAILTPIVVGGGVQAILVQNPGGNYAPSDTISIGGAGTGATATITLGALTGTYPGCVGYFQQRRFYANTLNNPDTYFASQPGAFLNMDSSIPSISSDAIIGTPWAQQVNGIQAMVPMPGGLVILTGLGAWQLSGGAAQSAVTPADQDAQPQAYNGCSPIVPPIPVNFDILYVQQRGSIVRDLSYNFFANIYTGTDMTVLSNHLFQNHQILQWGWAEEPYKIIWCIRDDGILLSFTFLKEQDIYAWARHDTNGLFVSVCVISEPPVNAPYFIVKRFIQGQWVYYSERMDNRLWSTVEDVWCVDAGLSYPMAQPDATLNAIVTSNTVGATCLFEATDAVFDSTMIGDVIRMGGGVATISAFVDAQDVQATITTPFATFLQDNPFTIVVPATSGNWSLSTPTTVVSGLNHLEGQTVAILADGSVVPNQIVVDGAITLPEPATAILVGLPFQAQLQTMYLDTGQPTIQGKRKTLTAITCRVEESRGVKAGSNQPDAATQPNNMTVPWGQPGSLMTEIKERSNQVSAGTAIPLFTGDERVNIQSSWRKPGQAAFQQDYPLPLNITAVVCEFVPGDDNG